MSTYNKYNSSGNFITAQVVIPADEFAMEMLGPNPSQQEFQDFISENGSLVKIIYGTAKIADIQELSEPLLGLPRMEHQIDYIHSHVLNKTVDEMLKDKRPWWKRILGL